MVADRTTFEPGVPVDWTFRLLDERDEIRFGALSDWVRAGG
jgi:hypothetical protein